MVNSVGIDWREMKEDVILVRIAGVAEQNEVTEEKLG